MKIVITSHSKSQIALDHLLESMKLDECFLEFELLIFIGGFANEQEYTIIKNETNITIVECNHNSIDFTGLIGLSELYFADVDEYYLYLHDTCKIGPEFYKKLKAIDLTDVSSIKLNKPFSMSMGIYSQKIITSFKDFLLSVKNTSEDRLQEFKRKAIETEDYIFKNDPKNKVLDNYNGHKYTGPVDYYKTGVNRIVEYYPNLDLYKIKANFSGFHANFELRN